MCNFLHPVFRAKYAAEHQQHDVYDMKCKVRELKEFGPGVLLYFHFLKHISFLFGALSVIALVEVIIYGLGQW